MYVQYFQLACPIQQKTGTEPTASGNFYVTLLGSVEHVELYMHVLSFNYKLAWVIHVH